MDFRLITSLLDYIYKNCVSYSNKLETIDYLRNNPDVYEKMTNRAYNFAQKNLTPDAITTYYKTMLTKVAERFIWL